MYLSLSLFMTSQPFFAEKCIVILIFTPFSVSLQTQSTVSKNSDSLHILQGNSWRMTCRKPNVFITLISSITCNNLHWSEKVFAINNLIQIRPMLKNCPFPITHIAKKTSPGQKAKLSFTLFKLNITFKCYLHHNCSVNLNWNNTQL